MKSERRLLPDFDSAVYAWRRNNWAVDARFWLSRWSKAPIDRPVFFIGNQGDGLTFVSRMVRRHSAVVSLSGNNAYWAGADEMHRALLGYLPASLSNGGRYLGGAPSHPVMTPPRSWSYATDDLLAEYRQTAGDVTGQARRRLETVIRASVRRHARDPQSARFVDKSQTFTVRMSYVDALLQDSDCHFVLITRDPYATCYRAALGKAGDMERYSEDLDLDARFELCVQHWVNSMNCVVTDRTRVSHFKAMAFEAFLERPRQALEELCDFLHLDFEDEMVPAEGQNVPFGSRFRSRWYPIRTDVNDRYLESLPDRYAATLQERLGERAAEFGYFPPKSRV